MKSINIFDVDSEIYDNNEDFLEKLFSLKLTISENINGTSFLFNLDSNKNAIYYKNLSTKISKIDRTIMKLYEVPIKYIEEQLKYIDSNIISDYTFKFDYFNNTLPKNILYASNNDVNTMILTYIIDNKTKKIITEKERLDYFAELFGVLKTPIFYQGYISDDEKIKIISYIKSQSGIVSSSESNFINFLITLLVGEPPIANDEFVDYDSIYISFDDEPEKYIAKVHSSKIDYSRKQHIGTKNKIDILPLIYSNIIDFLFLNIGEIEKYLFSKTEPDEKYIELITHFFNLFWEENKIKYKNIYYELPEFTKNKDFKLNKDFIDNSNTLEFIESKDAQEILKLFLLLFKKKRNKSADDFLNSIVKEYQKELTEKIWDKITNNKFDTLSVIDEQSLVIEDTIKSVNIDDSLNSLKIVSFWQEFLNKKEKKELKSKKNITIFIDNQILPTKQFQERILDKYDDIILIQLPNKSDISDDLYQKLYNIIKDNNSSILDVYTGKFDIKTLINIANKYKIENIIIGEKFINDIKIIFNYIRRNSKIEISKFEYLIYTENEDEIIIDSLKNDNFSLFKSIVIDDVNLFYQEIIKH